MPSIQFNQCVRASALLAGAAIAAACDPVNNNARVHINYEQVAVFQSYKLAPSSSSSTAASPDGLFIMYRIRQIANTGSEAQAFTFDKHKVVLVTQDKTTNEEPSSDNILLSNQLFTGVTVPAGQTLTKPGGLGCIIKVARSSNLAPLAGGALLDPIYQVNNQQPVSMHREPGNSSVAMILGDALPSASNVGLQQLCNTN
jgi:hypothetical protein